MCIRANMVRKIYVSYMYVNVYQTQYNLLEYHLKKKNPYPKAYLLVTNIKCLFNITL